MNISELFESSDYQGFHDSLLSSMDIDYVDRTVALSIDIVVDHDGSRPKYRSASLSILNFDFLVCEPPELGKSYLKGKKVPIQIKEGFPKQSVVQFPPMRSTSTAISIFVEEWNCFIIIAGESYSFAWTS